MEDYIKKNYFKYPSILNPQTKFIFNFLNKKMQNGWTNFIKGKKAKDYGYIV